MDSTRSCSYCAVLLEYPELADTQRDHGVQLTGQAQESHHSPESLGQTLSDLWQSMERRAEGKTKELCAAQGPEWWQSRLRNVPNIWQQLQPVLLGLPTHWGYWEWSPRLCFGRQKAPVFQSSGGMEQRQAVGRRQLICCQHYHHLLKISLKSQKYIPVEDEQQVIAAIKLEESVPWSKLERCGSGVQVICLT